MGDSTSDDLVKASDFKGTRVLMGEKQKKVGKVKCCVFHPRKKQCVGFLVKRPDAALMFRRKDLFVALDSYGFEGKDMLVDDIPDATDDAACKRLGVDLDDCVIWEGMPIISRSGEQLGLVEDVVFDVETGRVDHLIPHASAGSKFLLGEKTIPRSSIAGFRFGVGSELNVTAGEGDEEEALCGAIVVSDAAASIQAEGGFAEKAGAQSAIAMEKARQTKEKAKPAIDEAGRAAGKAVEKGAYLTGRQIGRAKGMFGAFKEEYEKAVGDDSGKSSGKSSGKKGKK